MHFGLCRNFVLISQSDDESKMRLYKLRSTWDNYFPLKRLFALDNTIHGLDPNWPVKPLPAHLQDHGATNIHVNPKFLKKVMVFCETAKCWISCCIVQYYSLILTWHACLFMCLCFCWELSEFSWLALYM